MRGILGWSPPRPCGPQIQGSGFSEPPWLGVVGQSSYKPKLADLACWARQAQREPNRETWPARPAPRHAPSASRPRPLGLQASPRVLRGNERRPRELTGRGFREEVWAPWGSVRRRASSPEVVVETRGARPVVTEECRGSSGWASMAWNWRLWSQPSGSWAGRARLESNVLSLTGRARPAPIPSTPTAALVEMLQGWLARFSLREAVERSRGAGSRRRPAGCGLEGTGRLLVPLYLSRGREFFPHPHPERPGNSLSLGREGAFWSLSCHFASLICFSKASSLR